MLCVCCLVSGGQGWGLLTGYCISCSSNMQAPRTRAEYPTASLWWGGRVRWQPQWYLMAWICITVTASHRSTILSLLRMQCSNRAFVLLRIVLKDQSHLLVHLNGLMSSWETIWAFPFWGKMGFKKLSLGEIHVCNTKYSLCYACVSFVALTRQSYPGWSDWENCGVYRGALCVFLLLQLSVNLWLF